MRVIGDIHGKIEPYLDIVHGNHDLSIQVGDFGMGFLYPYNAGRVEELHSLGYDKFIRGNHDDPALCREAPGWIEDGHYDEKRDMMCIGGAWSIDHDYRKRMMAAGAATCWWEDEELTLPELVRIHAEYVYRKPSIVITHDAPQSISTRFFFGEGKPCGLTNQYTTRTAQALDAMFRDHQPDIWLFGHWHHSHREKVNGTEFVCLAELEWIDI